MSTATLEFGCITCPACEGTKSILVDSGGTTPWGASIDISLPCERCDGEGTIPDPFFSDDPSAIIAAAKPGEDALRAWVQACRFKTSGKDGTWNEGHTVFHGTLADAVHAWCEDNGYQNLVTYSMRASILRCLIGPNPRTIERVECPECEHGAVATDGCQSCKGVGTIPKPLDSRWRTSTVLDLARGIRGVSVCSYCGKAKCEHIHSRVEVGGSPSFERLPILADALADAGCPDDGEIINHCRNDACHVAGCWVLDAILGKRAAGG